MESREKIPNVSSIRFHGFLEPLEDLAVLGLKGGWVCNDVIPWASGVSLDSCCSTSLFRLTSLDCPVLFLNPWMLSSFTALVLYSLTDL